MNSWGGAILVLKDVVKNELRSGVSNPTKPRKVNLSVAFAGRSPNPEILLILAQNILRRLAKVTDMGPSVEVFRGVIQEA